MSLRSDLSATSFTILGIVCKIASSILNELLVAAEQNKATLFCLVGVIISSAFYRQAPKRTQESTTSTKLDWIFLSRQVEDTLQNTDDNSMMPGK